MTPAAGDDVGVRASGGVTVSDGAQTPEQTSRAKARTRHPTVVLLVIGSSALLVSLSQTLLIPVMSELPDQLDTSVANVQWLLTSTLMVAAVSVPIMGRLSDMFGRRRMLLVALAMLAVGSLIDALTSDITLLIVGRAIQGVSMAAIPIGISLVPITLPPERVPQGIAMVSAMLGVGGAVGIPVAALIAEYGEYHMLFWVTAIGGILGFVGTLVFVPDAGTKTRGGIDVIGAALFVIVVLCLLIPLAQGGDWGWTSTPIVAMLITSGVTAVLFVLVEARRRSPLVDVRELRRPQIAITNVASILFGFALYASMIGTAGFVQAPVESGYGFGASVVVGGLCLLPGGLLMLVLAPISGRLINTYGPQLLLIVGAVVVAMGWLVRIFLTGSMGEVIIGTCVVGVGTGLGYAAMPALITKYAPVAALGAANSLNTLCRHTGSAAASALGGSLFAMSTVVIGTAEFPSLTAYRVLFAICAGTAALAAVLMLLMPKKSSESQEDA